MSGIASWREKNYKNFNEYKDDDHKIKPLPIILPKPSSLYVKIYDGEMNWMYFFIEDDELLEIYNSIWNKVSNSINKEL